MLPDPIRGSVRAGIDTVRKSLFPVTPSQSNGIEDARFVLFHKEDGTRVYYATYTAYDGRMILPQFLRTLDFLRFNSSR